MKKNHILKLTALALMVIMSLTVAVTSTYAWLTMSSSPVLEGLRVTVGGDNTIKVAADISAKTEDGTTVHYPAAFTEHLNLSLYSQYEYLGKLAGLSPVSTADGVNWFLPTYYKSSDLEVQNGNAAAGTIRPVQDFTREVDLTSANQTGPLTDSRAGHYAYFDLWVMSPSGDCDLRVATGTDPDDDSGSYVIALPDLSKGADGSFALNENASSVAASARVGFLVNTTPLSGESGTTALLSAISENSNTGGSYTSLRGVYAEKGSSTQNFHGSESFVIYEPNADCHPGSAADGGYIATYPVGADENGKGKEQSVFTNLTVQKQSTWKADGTGKSLLAGQLEAALFQFKTQLGEEKMNALTAEQAAELFYAKYLQGQYSFLVQKGHFFPKSATLSTQLDPTTRTIKSTVLNTYETAGATEDAVIVRLERNVPQRIRVFIWLEGQDADCTGAAENLRFAVNLQLAGANS